MKYKVGFFTARHNKIDGSKIGDSYIILQTIEITANSEVEAVKLAKETVNVNLLRNELTRRYPTAKIVNYTVQKVGKNQPRTWLRSFLSWRIIE
jgi:hypothetical protein